jgi:hypothetical protein
MDMERIDMEKFINQYLGNDGRNPDGKPASFDYCYNYFHSFYKAKRIEKLADNENLQISCLQIGFYLASFGMMRGSSQLLGRSVGSFKKLITAISRMDPKLWEIDLDNYSEETIELLLECKKRITDSLGKENKPTDNMVTRIMLGVFGNIPTFDQYFKNSFKMKKVTKKSLLKLKEIYEENKSSLNSFEVHTLDFVTGKETEVVYTRAKLLDIYGYMDGQLKKPEICMDCCIDI